MMKGSGVTAFRLRAGYYLFAGSESTGVSETQWFYATPELAFHVIHGPPDVVRTLADRVHTGDVDDDALEGIERDLVSALLGRGVLEQVTTAPSPAFRVLVDVADNVCAQVGDVLTCAGLDVVHGDAAECRLDGVRAVVVTSSHQRDAAWLDLDRRFRDADISWHRACFEGDTLVIGPLSIPGRTAGYTDCRGRQLAASRTPTELAALWNHLDTAPGVVRDGPAAITAQTVAAGLIAADLVALAAGVPLLDAGAQRVHHLASASTTVHRVLPLPDLATR